MSQGTDTAENVATPAAPAPDMNALVAAIARTLVSAPDEIEVESFEEDGSTVIELAAAPDDVTRLIGRGGRTARALRSILSAASAKLNQRFELDIVEYEEEDGDDEGPAAVEEDDNRGNRV